MENEQATLQIANREIADFLSRFPATKQGEMGPFPSSPEVASLTQRLRDAGRIVSETGASTKELPAMRAYIENLRRLQDLFTSLEPALFSERARLGQQHRQVVAARAWAAALKTTR